jgi:hypothetical protein
MHTLSCKYRHKHRGYTQDSSQRCRCRWRTQITCSPRLFSPDTLVSCSIGMAQRRLDVYQMIPHYHPWAEYPPMHSTLISASQPLLSKARRISFRNILTTAPRVLQPFVPAMSYSR